MPHSLSLEPPRSESFCPSPAGRQRAGAPTRRAVLLEGTLWTKSNRETISAGEIFTASRTTAPPEPEQARQVNPFVLHPPQGYQLKVIYFRSWPRPATAATRGGKFK